MKKAILRVNGRVQGVFFRAEAQTKALQLGLKGYAQNNRDGSVTVVAVGDELQLKKLADWCRENPGSAKVDNVEETYEDVKPDENFSGFGIR